MQVILIAETTMILQLTEQDCKLCSPQGVRTRLTVVDDAVLEASNGDHRHNGGRQDSESLR